MKKTLYSVLFLYGFVSVGFAQTRMTVGLRTGVNVANYKFDFGTTPISNVALFTIGVPLEIIFNRHFAVQAELGLVQKGFASKVDISDPGFAIKSEGKVVVSWLEIPILAKAKFGAPDGFGGGIFFGPSIGYGLSGKSKGTGTVTVNGVTTTESSDKALDFKADEHSRVDIGLNFGGEINYGSVYLDARYQLGLTNMITNKTTTIAGSQESAKTRGFAITLGYRIPIGIGTVKEVNTKKK